MNQMMADTQMGGSRAPESAASACARREAPPPELAEAGREETHHATDRNRRAPTREVGDLPANGPTDQRRAANQRGLERQHAAVHVTPRVDLRDRGGRSYV